MTRNATFRLTGPAGQSIEIPESQWYMNTKHRARRIMQTPLSTEAQRVYACLELATMGYSQELAVTMEHGKKRRLLCADIMRQTGLKRQNVDRALTELEAAGLAERRQIDPTLPLQKGNVEIYSWANPREVNALEGNCNARDDNRCPWAPPGWSEPTSPIYKALRRYKITLAPGFQPEGDYISEVEDLAAQYQKAEDCLIAKLRLSGARQGLSGARANGDDPSLLLERNGKENNNNRVPEPSPEPEAVVVVVAPTPEAAEVETVYEALSEHGQTTRKASASLIAECRRKRPDCAVEWILDLMRGFRFGPLTANPVGVILKALPLRLVDYRPRGRPETEDERKRREAAYVLEHPDEFEAESVAWARTVAGGGS